MKRKNTLLIAVGIFFLLINTSYFWEPWLYLYAMPATIILVAAFLILVIVLLRQLFLLWKEKFKNRTRLRVAVVLSVVVLTTYVKPLGLINFEKWKGKDLLVAESEGVANCHTTFRLKENNTFSQRTFCFGTEEITGRYRMINDTIYFENVNAGRQMGTYSKFALIKTSAQSHDDKRPGLYFYNDAADSVAGFLWITKNNLP